MLNVLNATHGHASEAREQALLILQELVEDLDKARDLRYALDGYPVIAGVLSNASEVPRLHALASWVLGTAAQNQRDLQLHLLELGVLPVLLRLASDAQQHVDTRGKALFATAALVRNNPEGQHTFAAHDGVGALLSALDSLEPRLVRKALVLLADLVHESLAAQAAAASGRTTYDGHVHSTRPPPLWHADAVRGRGELLCRAVLQCLRVEDVDSQEKAVQALKYLHAAGLVAPAEDADADEGHGSESEGGIDSERARGEGVAPPRAGGVADDDCRRRGVPDELRRLIAHCAERRRLGGGAPSITVDDVAPGGWDCAELLPSMRDLDALLRGKAGPAVRTIESETVFHIEV